MNVYVLAVGNASGFAGQVQSGWLIKKQWWISTGASAALSA